MRLTLHTAPDPALRAPLFAAIDAFNDDASGRPEPVRHLSIALRDGAGGVVGGLVGISYYDWLIVEMLYVPEALRGRGLGARLMAAAEAVAAARGCRGVWLDTGSPQALRFYGWLGYAVFATLPDQPLGHPRHFLAREAPRAGPVEGMEIHEARLPEVATVIGPALTQVGDALVGADPGRATLAILAEDDAGQAQGGLWMMSRRGWMFLDLFILGPTARRAGLGSRILAMAEQEARRRGLAGVWLDTYGFQAPGFYARHGYREFGALPACPAPHARHFLAKRF
jgi:GNAT superfamily N-acetyltransferase